MQESNETPASYIHSFADCPIQITPIDDEVTRNANQTMIDIQMPIPIPVVVVSDDVDASEMMIARPYAKTTLTKKFLIIGATIGGIFPFLGGLMFANFIHNLPIGGIWKIAPIMNIAAAAIRTAR